MNRYKQCLTPDGLLIISGFMKPDVDVLIQKAQFEGLTHLNTYHKDEWFCLVLKNIEK